MRKIFFISFLLISFCSFSQSYQGFGHDKTSGYDFIVNLKITRISDGKYSGRLMKSGSDKVVKFDISRFEKDMKVKNHTKNDKYNYTEKVDMVEYCNITFYEEKKRTTKCAIHRHKNGNIFLYFWNDWEEKYENRLDLTYWTLIPVE